MRPILHPIRIEALETRITPAPVFAQLNLVSGLTGANGFNITGTGVSGVNVEIEAVANAGDVNNDGIDDLLVGIPADSNNNKGRAAVIFGKEGGFPLNINLDSLGAAGVLFTGQVNGDFFGQSVSGVGDVNGDGIDDFVIGAPGNDVGVAASERGAAYVIFGKAGLASFGLATLDGTNGFKIVGDTRRTGLSGIAQAVGGFNLAGTGAGGDFNGDGFADVLIGAQDIKAFTTGGADSGAAFIVFGKNTNPTTGGSAFTTPLAVDTLNGTNGLMIGSSTGSDFMGSEVGFVGDLNGDGLTDLSLGNMVRPELAQRRSFIIFGKASGNPATIDVNFLTPEQGFAGPEATNANFVGPISYGSEWVLRDIDGDGDQDLGVSFVHQQFLSDPIQGYTFVKNTGKGYTANPFTSLSKEVRQGLLGFDNVSVDADLYDLGDFNGDGFYDIAAFPPFVPDSLPDVFNGRAPAKNYIANNGNDSSGVSFTGLTIPVGNDDPNVFFIGDINGDGIDDVLVFPSGASSSSAAAPNAYVVFGDSFHPSTDGKSVTYTDLDGDKVTVKTSVGQFTRGMFTFSTAPDAVQNGQRLDLLDFSTNQAFAGANLTVSVKKAAGGDGRADIGAIDATGVDLGNVVIAGGLGSINAGNSADFEKPGLNKLDVYKFGGTGVADSVIRGRIGSVIVDTTFESAVLRVDAPSTEGLGSIAIAGDFSGTVNVPGVLGTFKAVNLLAGALIKDSDLGTKKTTIAVKNVADGVSIELNSVLGKFTATQAGTVSIEAPRIDTISITGDTKLGLPGSFAGEVVSNLNGLGSITVKGNFSGKITLNGPASTLTSFKAFDVLSGAIIHVEGASTKKTSITAHVIGDGVTIDVASVIGKLAAARIGDAAITADRLDTLSVTGDTKLAITGDFAADLTLDNAGVADGTIKALGSAKIAGLFHDAKILVAGSVGAFSAGAMQAASLFAGFTPGNAAAPLNGGTFQPDAQIGAFTITGKAEIAGGITASDGRRTALDDVFVIATRLGSVSLTTLDSTTGALAWGFAFHESIKSLKVKEPLFAYDVDTGGTQASDDFSVRQLP